MKSDKLFEIQKQIRDNQVTITNYMKDFSNWEKEMEQKDSLLRKENTNNQTQSIVLEKQNEKNFEKNKKIKENLKRDGTSIRNYYDNWGKFDVDEEIEEIEGPKDKPTIIKSMKLGNKQQNTNVINPNSTVGISSNDLRERLNNSNYNAEILKRDGVSFFKMKNYNKAIELFTHAISLKNLDKDIKISLLNNRGNCYLKLLLYKEALKDLEESFALFQNDLKTVYRLSFSYFKLNMFDLSLRLIHYALNDLNCKEGGEYDLFKLLEKDNCFQLEICHQETNNFLKKVIWSEEDEENYEIIFTKDIEENEPVLNNQENESKDVKETKQSKTIKSNKTSEIQKVNINEELVLNYVDKMIAENATSSSFRLAFSNLSGKDKLRQRVDFMFKINPDKFPSIFKNDMDKDLLNDILECLNFTLPQDQLLVIEYLKQITKINRFSLVNKFIKKDSKVFYLVKKSIFDQLDIKYESSFISLKDQFLK